MFGNDTLKSIQNYIALVVRILRIIRHLWDWDSLVVTTVLAVIMSLSLLLHSTILNFKYTWITLIIFLFIVLTPIWDYGLFGLLRTVTNIGTYLKVNNTEKAKRILEKANAIKKETELYRESYEDEEENENQVYDDEEEDTKQTTVTKQAKKVN